MRSAPLSPPRSPAFAAHAAGWTLAGLGALLYIGWTVHSATSAVEPHKSAPIAAADMTRLERRLASVGEDLLDIRGKLAAGEDSTNALLTRVAALEEKSALVTAAVPAPPAAPLTTAALPAAEPKLSPAPRAAEITTGAILQRTATPPPDGQPPTLALTPLPTSGPAVITGAASAPQPASLPVSAAPPTPKVPHGIQLSSATNLDALRLNWSLLNERHRALGPLQTLYRQTPGKPNAPYQLIAGPVRSAAEAAKICKELAGSGVACRATTFTGEAL